MQRGITLSGFRKNKGVVWILPAFLFLVVIIYYSMFFTFDLSTASWDGLSPVREAVGLKNYEKLFGDKVFWKCLQNTLVYLVVTFVVQNALGFIFAVILHSDVKLPTLFKCLIFIPTILAPATMAPVFRLLFSPQKYPSPDEIFQAGYGAVCADVGHDLGIYGNELHPVLCRDEPD